MAPVDLDKYLSRLDGAAPARVRGRIRELTGLLIKASVPGAVVGELVEIERVGAAPLPAQVVGFQEELVVLMALGGTEHLSVDATVRATGQPLVIQAGDALLGRVLDGLGRPMDGGPPLEAPGAAPWAVERPAPHPLQRPRIRRVFQTGVRAIDGLLTLGEGQRVGLFAGSGVGKSSLLGQITRASSAEVVVIALVGERGREVREFLDECLGEQGLRRSVVVCATSDQPPLVRIKAAHVATAIAEHFRERGRRVLLLMDSLTRYARALREVGLAAGEPPARQGFPPSVFRALPELLERAGPAAAGSITAIYSVLLSGEDMDDPIADEARSILDGHIVLSRRLAQRGRWPAIDPLLSLSRLMDRLVDAEHREAAQTFRRTLGAFEDKRDLIALGAWKAGVDPDVDLAVRLMPEMEELLQQPLDALTDVTEARERLLDLFA